MYVYTAEGATERAVKRDSMGGEGKSRRRSGYVVENDKQVLEAWVAGT